jgi:hypothetical protein
MVSPPDDPSEGKERPEEEVDNSSKDLPPAPSPNQLDDIEFIVGDLVAGSPLAVTVASGPIGKSFAPADVIGKLATKIGALVHQVAGSETMLYGIAPGNSMTLFFGDPKPDGAQTELALGATESAAVRIAELVEADADEFMEKALAVGAPMVRYDELAQLVQSEGMMLSWKPRNAPARRLTPDAAGRQHTRLQRPPEMTEWDIPVNGILYRLIAEPGADKGTAGIHLFNWSDKPPGAGPKVIAGARTELLDGVLDNGLFRKPVQARLRVRRPKPGQSIAPERIEKEWISIAPGEAEDSGYGMSLDDLLGEEPDSS